MSGTREPSGDGWPAGAAAVKERLRARARQRLASVDTASLATASERIADTVLRLPELAAARGVLVCLSFGREIDTWRLAERLLESGRPLFVPRADPRDRQLHVHRYPCPLRTLSFGLRQPPRGTPELDARQIAGEVDLALVLGLAYDRRGYRLGHGTGYFDRFLARHPVVAVALTLSQQVFAQLPEEPHDLPMTMLVTEREVVRPATAGGAPPP